jgi:hypothetical protein
MKASNREAIPGFFLNCDEQSFAAQVTGDVA